MAEGSGIQKNDIISQGAIETWTEFIALAQKAQTELLELVKVGPKVNESLNKAGTPTLLSESIKDVTTNLKLLIETQKQLDLLNNKLLGGHERAIAAKKAEADAAKKAKEAAKLEAEEKKKNIRIAKEQEKADKAAARAAEKAAKERIRYAQQVSREAAKASAETKAFTTELEKHAAKSKKAAKENSTLGSSFLGLTKNVGATLMAYAGVTTIVDTIMNTFSSIVTVTKKLDSLGFSLKTIITDTFELAQTQNFIRDTVKNYGTDLADTTNAYIKFRAAVGSSNIEIKEGQQIFDSMAKASAVLGLSQEKTNLVFLALEQMLSKGTIGSEELRRQMGEQMPVAMQAMATAFHNVTKEGDSSINSLMKFMKEGKVISQEVLPEFARQVEIALGIETVTKVDTLMAAQNRLNTSWSDFVKRLKAAKPLIQAYESLSSFVDKVSRLITPDKDIISERSTDILTGTMQRLEGVTDLEERRKILAEEYIKLQEKSIKVNKTVADSEKDRSNAFFLGLSKVNRAVGLGPAFTSAIDFEEVYKDTALDASAYAKALEEIRTNFEKFAAVPPAKKLVNITGDDDTKSKDTFNDELSQYKNLQDAKLSAYIEHLENLRKIQHDKAVDSNLSEVEFESTTNGMKMQMDTDVFNFKLKQMQDLLAFVKAHGKDTSDVEKDIADLKADYAKKTTDFAISEDERFHKEFMDNREKELRQQEDNVDAQIAEIERWVQERSLALAEIATDKSKNAKYQFQFDEINRELEKEAILTTIEGYEKMLAIEGLTVDKRAEFAQRLHNLKMQLNEQERADSERTAQEELQRRAEVFEMIQQSANTLFNYMAGLQDARMEQLEWDYERDLNLAGDNVDQKIAVENQYAEEKRKLQRRQAILDRATSLFNIAIDTWKGVTAAMSSVVTIPLVPFIKLQGLLAAAAVIATPLPQYEFGGQHEGGPARFSEKGAELFIPDRGAPILTPNTETVANMPSGTFIPHDETQMMLSQLALSNFEKEVNSLSMHETNTILRQIANKDEIIYANGFKMTNKNNIFGKYVTRN